MAKSTRANTIKRNRANLRTKVFGPESEARTERLATKLQEVASQPKQEEAQQKESDMDTGASGAGGQNGNAETTSSQDMDVDGTSSKIRSNARKAGRIQKRQKRNRHPVAFPSSSSLPNLAKRKKT
ncbi:hypothetical protein PHISP_05934 [Aspergillus sp. HF37]|nr:hypothetical protein PHISP_05934 [Aspergillus sp. HF37]